MYKHVTLLGWGKALPASRLSNDDLSQFLDTNDEWIFARTGIKERRISAFPVSEMAALAASNALACAGLGIHEVDLLILCTTTPDTLVPSAASRTLAKLGGANIACFDLNAACGGFLYAMHLAASLIESGAHRRILLVGAERLSWFQNWSQRSTSILFGDGAGALLLCRDEQAGGAICTHIGGDCRGNEAIKVTDYGAGHNRYLKTSPSLNFLFDGKDVFKQAVSSMLLSARQVMAQACVDETQLDLYIGHQANARILQVVADKLGLDDDKVFSNIRHYGNTSAASIPIAVCEAIQQQRVRAGQRLLLTAFGAGYTFAAAYLKLPERLHAVVSPLSEQIPQMQSGLELIWQAVERDQRHAWSRQPTVQMNKAVSN
ncbi:ketoacyl-ACP synthase III [Bowmanella denitrificans]|uniref:Ketoacyl-ACP synthase III n=1 Tax=Bowmanella denitrificans TaxID=366582 RepID=A0ABN0WVG4_9ALTE